MNKQGQARRASPERTCRARRLRRGDLEWIADRLSARDWQIIEATNTLRVVSGRHLERLCFQALDGHAREVVRGRVLRRLVRWQVLTVLPRRVGGAARGSAGAVFALGAAGARLCAERQAAAGCQRIRVRRPELPTERTVRHTLAISELCTNLVEQTTPDGVRVLTFVAEPACWWPDGLGGFLKPDAYIALELHEVREHWWIEVDLATESLPTLNRKLRVYLDFVVRGQVGPSQLVPRILVTAPTCARCARLHALVRRLPAPADELFHVVPLQAAATALLRSLND